MLKNIFVKTFITGSLIVLTMQSCSKGGGGGGGNGGGGNGGGGNGGGGGGGTTCTGTAGPLFTEVKNLINARCLSCHNSGLANGGVSYTDECNIVAKKDRIKVRAVDEGTMPQTGGPLSQAEKDKITAWINAGGGYNN